MQMKTIRAFFLHYPVEDREVQALLLRWLKKEARLWEWFPTWKWQGWRWMPKKWRGICLVTMRFTEVAPPRPAGRTRA